MGHLSRPQPHLHLSQPRWWLALRGLPLASSRCLLEWPGSALYCGPLVSLLDTPGLMLRPGMPRGLSGPQCLQCGDAGELMPHRLNCWPSRDVCWWTDCFTSSPLWDWLSKGQLTWLLGKQSPEIKQWVAGENRWLLLLALLSSLLSPSSLTLSPLELYTLTHKLVSQTLFFFPFRFQANNDCMAWEYIMDLWVTDLNFWTPFYVVSID